MIEVVTVMFILTALALVAVPVGRNALTHRQERQFMETLIEEWEMLKMKARSDHKNGDMYVKGSERQVEFATIDGKFLVLKFPPSLTYNGSSTISCNPRGKITQAGSLNFKYAEERFWRVSFQLGWGRGVFVKN